MVHLSFKKNNYYRLYNRYCIHTEIKITVLFVGTDVDSALKIILTK